MVDVLIMAVAIYLDVVVVIIVAVVAIVIGVESGFCKVPIRYRPIVPLSHFMNIIDFRLSRANVVK